MINPAGQHRVFHGGTYDPTVDFERLRNNQQRVFFLLADGEWHTPQEIERVGGARGLTRVRALREARFGGIGVESERVAGGAWRYRIADISQISPELVRKYTEWDFETQRKVQTTEYHERIRSRLHRAVDKLTGPQLEKLASFARIEKWWAFGYNFVQWGRSGQR